jgi:regulator of protease activity HflC (stomatin/prohibitin superfamily)
MKKSIPVVVAIVLVCALLWGSYRWFFCRFYVHPGEMAIVISKSGKALPSGQILAKEGQKGIREAVLGEGRHFLDPILYDVEIRPVVTIPPGKVGLVTSKVGEELPGGEFLAGTGQKGIQRGLLGPGRYRLNPYGYAVEITEALSIPIGYVGVVTSLSGDQAPEAQFAGPKQKGVRADVLQPGLYYANPKEFKVDVLEIGVNQVSLLGKDGGAVVTKKAALDHSASKAIGALQQHALMEQQERRRDYLEKSRPAQAPAPPGKPAAKPKKESVPSPSAAPRPESPSSVAGFVLDQFVTFPSRDGFEISLDMTVEFELEPEDIAWVFRQFGDLPAVVDNIIMPQILSISRLKGSAYRATDFIVGEGREKFQVDLKESLSKTLAERRIVVHNALIRNVNVPDQILQPIQQASMAQEEDLTNQEKQNTARKQAQLNTEMSLIQQKGQEVEQQTERIKAVIRAEQEKQVAEINADTLKKTSEIAKKTAEIRAEKTRTLGKAQADVKAWVEGERAKGLKMQTDVFGDPTAFALWEFSSRLNPEIRVNLIHAGEGTLWTDLEKATLGELGGAAMLRKGQAASPHHRHGKDAKGGPGTETGH